MYPSMVPDSRASSTNSAIAAVLRKHFSEIAFALAILVSVLPCELRAERVGFRFEGNLQPPLFGSNKLFGMEMPGNEPIVGTFSYDVNPGALSGPPSPRSYPQSIHGGLFLNLDNGAIRLSASEYVVSVWDNFERQMPQQTVDVFQVGFNRGTSLDDPTLLFNDVPWTKQAFINIEINWPAETFAGPDEPKLTTDRPSTPWSDGIYPIAGVGSGTTLPRTFSITSISPITPLAGDYNRNGLVDADDYSEWKQAFGSNAEYADGNNDGIADAVDYTIWRDALGLNSLSGVGSSSVPEPSWIMTVAGSLVFLFVRLQRHFQSILRAL